MGINASFRLHCSGKVKLTGQPTGCRIHIFFMTNYVKMSCTCQDNLNKCSINELPAEGFFVIFFFVQRFVCKFKKNFYIIFAHQRVEHGITHAQGKNVRLSRSAVVFFTFAVKSCLYFLKALFTQSRSNNGKFVPAKTAQNI